MRHRRKGRTLGRFPSHQRALLKNLASALFLTERDAEDDDNKPKVKGRIVTTLEKAKEVRPLVEKCITLARRTLAAARGRRPVRNRCRTQQRPWRAVAQERQVEEVGRGHRSGRRRSASGAAAAGRQAGRADPVRRRSPRVRGSPGRVHPRLCGWPSPAWETPARGQFWSSSAFAIVWPARPRRPSSRLRKLARPIAKGREL